MRRAFGKGLAQLMSEPATAPTSEVAARDPKSATFPKETRAKSTGEPTKIGLDRIRANRNQPRTRFENESLQELADSIRAVGVIQPVVVRPLLDNAYELIAGERRYRASILAGLTEIPAYIRTASDQSSLEMALIENVQREDISAIEAARAYKRLMDEFDLTQEAMARRVGKSRAGVANTLRLLRLPDKIQAAIESGQVSEGQVRPLLAIDSPENQLAIFEKVVGHELSARQVESLVKSLLERPETPEPKTAHQDPNLNALEEQLRLFFSAPTAIQRGKKGGKLVVSYFNDDDLQRILDLLGVRL
ncbi:MAG: ParB/RepB/Spo0J family partition protein [Armatimonadetes bacterium]|nr:ParB/RepB/Spo0J family partition protein [Armatimonadota bacterium]